MNNNMALIEPSTFLVIKYILFLVFVEVIKRNNADNRMNIYLYNRYIIHIL